MGAAFSRTLAKGTLRARRDRSRAPASAATPSSVEVLDDPDRDVYIEPVFDALLPVVRTQTSSRTPPA
jgi:hypothetical protein